MQENTKFIWISLLAMVLGSFTTVNANPPYAAEALRAHNQVRAQDKQRPLKWSKDLESISQQWANQLARSCKMYHHKGQIPFGENLFYSSAPTSVAHAVRSWANEKKLYNHKQNSCQAGKQCGHYTQIVWKGTTDVGCGVKRCANGSEIWVCSYFPAGNIVGARPF